MPFNLDRSKPVKKLLTEGKSVRTVAAELGISKTTVMKVKAGKSSARPHVFLGSHRA
ncbi:MAG: helix-turn-helix domain-containing protein [Candidatus Obscuribacterales bacterium]|nr:helix-turn-helix domain-containing protein [Candidatus Obscuribacterales bacterium]